MAALSISPKGRPPAPIFQIPPVNSTSGRTSNGAALPVIHGKPTATSITATVAADLSLDEEASVADGANSQLFGKL
jgi:hypothetical protein